MNKLDTKMTIGDSVIQFPALSGVYMNYGVDYCCGGDRSIDEAIRDSSSKRDEVVSALEEKLVSIDQMGETTIKLNELSNNQLIDNIIERHHGYLRKTLPELGINLFKLIEVHGGNHPELFEIHHMIGLLRIELEQHLVKEEKRLFPLIRSNSFEKVRELIDELENEHDAAGDILKKLTVVTDHFTLPKDACSTYTLTYKRLQELQADMYEHVHKENSVLFKRFE